MSTLPWPRPVRLPDRAFADHPDRACNGKSPNLFFDENPEPAKEVCRRCPFKRECFEFAYNGRLDFGVFGATTGTERERIRKQERRRQRGDAA